jgi:hypothetical protein
LVVTLFYGMPAGAAVVARVRFVVNMDAFEARSWRALGFVFLSLSIGCGRKVLDAKDVSKISLTSQVVDRCTNAHGVEVEAFMKDGKSLRSSGKDGFNPSRGLKFSASIGSVRPGEEFVFWYPPKDTRELLNVDRVIVRASLVDSPETTSVVTIPFEFGKHCSVSVNLRGGFGASGASGRAGDERSLDGANGESAGSGFDAGRVRVEVTSIESAKHGSLVNIRGVAGDGKETVLIVRPDAKVTIDARGGDGGSGGNGGEGYWSGKDCSSASLQRSTAGRGGNAGNGGNGGNGGDLTLSIDSRHPEYEGMFSVDVGGGAAGAAGAPGRGGVVNMGYCRATRPNGSPARDGVPGREGVDRVELVAGLQAGSTRAGGDSSPARADPKGAGFSGDVTIQLGVAGAPKETKKMKGHLLVTEKGEESTFLIGDCSVRGRKQRGDVVFGEATGCSVSPTELEFESGTAKKLRRGWTVHLSFKVKGRARDKRITGSYSLDGKFDAP